MSDQTKYRVVLEKRKARVNSKTPPVETPFCQVPEGDVGNAIVKLLNDTSAKPGKLTFGFAPDAQPLRTFDTVEQFQTEVVEIQKVEKEKANRESYNKDLRSMSDEAREQFAKDFGIDVATLPKKAERKPKPAATDGKGDDGKTTTDGEQAPADTLNGTGGTENPEGANQPATAGAASI
jgi:hypothetical protein